MVCTILNVIEPYADVNVKDITYGFAEVEWVNRMFQDPCEENDIIGSREAVGLVFTVENANKEYGSKTRFTVNYLRPGETAKRSWNTVFTFTDGTYERFMYNTELKYKKGQYTGLTLEIDFLK